MEPTRYRFSLIEDRNRNLLRFVFWYQDRGRYFCLAPMTIEENEASYQWVEVEEGAYVPAALVLPRAVAATPILQEIVNEISEQMGIVAPKAKEAESLLKLKDAHLEDLRKILFGFNWIELQRGKPVGAEE